MRRKLLTLASILITLIAFSNVSGASIANNPKGYAVGSEYGGDWYSDPNVQWTDGTTYNGNITVIDIDESTLSTGVDYAVNDQFGVDIDDRYDDYSWDATPGTGDPYQWVTSPDVGNRIFFLAEYNGYENGLNNNYIFCGNLEAIQSENLPEYSEELMLRYEPIPHPVSNYNLASPTGPSWINLSIPHFKYTDYNYNSLQSEERGTFDAFESYAVYIKGGEYNNWTHMGNSQQDPQGQGSHSPIHAYDSSTDPTSIDTGSEYFNATGLDPNSTYEFKVRVNFSPISGEDTQHLWGPKGGGSITSYLFSTPGPQICTSSSADSPEITITEPNGGESWKTGTNQNITWNTNSGDGNITSVDLKYSTDNGTSWTSIVNGTTDDGIYEWTIPDESSTKCLVKGIVHDDKGKNGSDISDGSFEIIGDPPKRPEKVMVKYSGSENGDNNVSWEASLDDGSGDDDVMEYNLYRSNSATGPWNESSFVNSIPSSDSDSYHYIDADKGKNDSTKWWYLVRAVDVNNLLSKNSNPSREPMKTSMNLSSSSSISNSESDGWTFLSLEFAPFNSSLFSILNDPANGINGSYDKVMYYDAESDEWKTYVKGRGKRFNDITNWNRTMGIWIHMTADDDLVIQGNPRALTNITLHPGWNMVGYPSGTDRKANDTLPDQVSKIGVFDTRKEYNIDYIYSLSNYTISAGEGYWVYNSGDSKVEWTVEY